MDGSTKGGFWDPLGCLRMSFSTLDKDQTVRYLRHAEIKHGRIAMAGFLGYCVANPMRFCCCTSLLVVMATLYFPLPP